MQDDRVLLNPCKQAVNSAIGFFPILSRKMKRKKLAVLELPAQIVEHYPLIIGRRKFPEAVKKLLVKGHRGIKDIFGRKLC